ncbi:MAG TPA: ATP-binding protein [Thermoleophilaceae bacterium]|nr:ATP-binding protein [Thermoleophilaceae bacterium]
MRPLDRLPSIKVKFGVVIVAAVAVTAIAIAVGVSLGVPLVVCALAAAALALAMVQVLARGMTSPLREMAAASRAMARGDHERRVAATSRDEVGELARAFNTMAGELGEVDRMRRELIANVSHELRTPITGLQATLENLIDGVEQPDRETLELMHAQVERLGRLIAQLLDLSRLETAGTRLERERFEVAGLLDAAAGEARLHAQESGRAVELIVDVPNGLTVYGDRDRLHQVVANLIDNAVRHSPKGGRVVVSGEQAAGSVAVAVADEGPGIPPAERSRVFERFYRIDAARAAADGGTGLGLAIARGIVDLHGGLIQVEQAPGGGCRMVVVLPEPAR